jgi:hypothetical protein
VTEFRVEERLMGVESEADDRGAAQKDPKLVSAVTRQADPRRGVWLSGKVNSASMSPVYEDFRWWTPWFLLASFLIGLGSLVIFLLDKALD